MARIGNKNRSLQISGILCAAFVLLLLLVKIIDVRHIGPNYTKVGFAALNGLFYKIGYHPFWYGLTQVLGILALVVALAFALLGVYQLVKRKSIGAVDADIVLLGVIYVITILLYLFFNAVVVNYRPVMLEEAMEASFPSSHTVLASILPVIPYGAGHRCVCNSYHSGAPASAGRTDQTDRHLCVLRTAGDPYCGTDHFRSALVHGYLRRCSAGLCSDLSVSGPAGKL